MKVVKPMKVPILSRTFEDRRRPHFHVAAFLGFPLANPRALLDELAFWDAVQPALGGSLVDESLTKAHGEVLVAGNWYAPGGKAVASSFVRVKVGAVDKRLAVYGDRHWVRGKPSDAKAMTTMPIDWSHAFGGPQFPRNLRGMGMETVKRDGEEVRPLPNVERFGAPMTSQGQTPDPDGFLPMDMTFEQRRARAGTFGPDYLDRHAPGLPPDHHPTVWNLAPADQWIAGAWRGDERVLIENMSPDTPKLESDLPGLVLRAFVHHKTAQGLPWIEIGLRLDTLWFFPSIGLGAIGFHGSLPVAEDDAADITHLLVACEEPAAPRSAEHYRDALVRRLDKVEGALNDLSDSDIMPDRASGVAANMDLGSIGQWVKSEQIGMANAHRGAQRTRDRRREELIAAGVDPAPYGLDKPLPPPEAPPATDDLEALAKYLVDMEARVAKEEAAAAELRKALPAARDEAPQEPPPVGPPEPRAQATLAWIHEVVLAARAAGAPDEELERKLEDPAFFAGLVEQDRMAVDTYRQAAHLTPAALPMTAEANQMARVVLQAARDSGESLAERDFTGVDFRGCDLSGMDLRRAFLEGADLREANLAGADLEQAVLARANLQKAQLDGAHLVGANLGQADLEGASLIDADLSKTVLQGARIGRANLAQAQLVEADLLEVDWKGGDLSGAILDRCFFMKADLAGVRLAGASLVQATFLQCNLDGVDFTEANLHKSTFITCKGDGVLFARARLDEAVLSHENELPRADFTDARAEKCCLRTTKLPNARFDRAQMTMADLSECDATDAALDQAVLVRALLLRTQLKRASLRGANLTEALLSKSRIEGADFTGAQLTRAVFTHARGDDKTRFSEAVLHFTRFDSDGSRKTEGGAP